MTHYRLFLNLLFLLLLACNDAPPEAQATDTMAADTITKTTDVLTRATRACYTSTTSQDSIELQLDFKNDSVTGTMNYQISGKDKNKGNLRGTVRGDSIFAEYSFSSEGKQSVREVAFLQKADSLLEGYGDVEEKAGRMIFKNGSALSYGKGVVLRKTGCTL